MKALTLYEEINVLLDSYQPHEIYYPMKAYGIRYIRPTTMKLVMACVIVDYMGLPITINLMASICEKSKSSTSHVMARLGDKKVLNLKGYTKNMLTYEVDNKFKTQLKMDFTIIDNFVARWNDSHDN